MSVVLEGVVQASLIVSIGVVIFSGLFHKMYNRWKPAGMLLIWRILGIRLCILYPLVYKIFAVNLQQGSSSYTGTTDFAPNMAVHSYFSVALPRQGVYVLFWIWITGAVLFLGIYFIRFQIAMKKLLNSSEKISNLYELSLQYGLLAKSRWKRVEVRCCGAMNGPMLIGFYKKYLLIPEKNFRRAGYAIIIAP
jgi:beta-lactamase regulating signal transducer with metallopeptidase domain